MIGATHVDERTARRVAEEVRQTEWELPSFGKQFFLGDFRLDLIHPHLESDERMRSKGEVTSPRFGSFAKQRWISVADDPTNDQDQTTLKIILLGVPRGYLI
jgi:hypothetical protein